MSGQYWDGACKTPLFVLPTIGALLNLKGPGQEKFLRNTHPDIRALGVYAQKRGTAGLRDHFKPPGGAGGGLLSKRHSRLRESSQDGGS